MYFTLTAHEKTSTEFFLLKLSVSVTILKQKLTWLFFLILNSLIKKSF